MQSVNGTEQGWDDLYDFLDPTRDQKKGHDRNVAAGKRWTVVRTKLVYFFAGRGCCDAEALADLTMTRAAAKISDYADTWEGDRTRYFYGFAKNVFKESVKPEPSSLPMPEPEPSHLKETRYNCLTACMNKLTPRARRLALCYYREEKAEKIECRKRLADEIGKSLNGLRIEMHRIRKTLRRCVFECTKTAPEATDTVSVFVGE